MLPSGPGELTGAYVAAFREHHKLGRDAWASEVGHTGGPQWRIEKKNLFKEDERERTWTAITARGGAIELNVSDEVAPTKSRVDGESGPAKTKTPGARARKVDVSRPTSTITFDFVPPVFRNDFGGATEPTDDEEEDQATPTFTLTSETVPTTAPVASAIPLPAGWEYFYPPGDHRHLHKFLPGTTKCANASCGVTTSGLSVTEPDDESITKERAAELIRVGASTPTYQHPLLTLEVKSDVRPVSNSEANDARRCWRKWWLNWYLGLRRSDEDKLGYAATGDRVHRALAGWYVPDGMTRVDPRDGLERAIVEDWTVLYARANERGMDEEYVASLATKFMKVNSLERAMVEGYLEWIRETGADSELVITGSEKALAAPLHVVVGGEEVPVEVIGKLDARFRRVSDDVRGFMDHKTVGDLKDPIATLVGDNQMFTYILLEYLNSEEGERAADTALYNMLRRVKRTATANPPFYDRVEVPHSVPELEFFKAELESVATQIVTMTRRLDDGEDPRKIAYRSWGKQCKNDCDHFIICPLFNDPGSRADNALEDLYVRTDPLARYDGIEVIRPTP